MYCKCGEIDMDHELYDGINEKDLISWNTLIDGYPWGNFIKKVSCVHLFCLTKYTR